MGETYTENFSLIKHDDGDIDWGGDLNDSLDTIDDKIYDPLSHTHIHMSVTQLEINRANNRFGVISMLDVESVDADATYGAAERDLINEMKATINELLGALRTSTGCGVLRFDVTTTTTTTSSSTTSSSSTTTTSSSTTTTSSSTTTTTTV